MRQLIVIFALSIVFVNCTSKSDYKKLPVKKVEKTVSSQNQFQQSNDSIQFQISTDKVIYSPQESIKVTIRAKNTTDHLLKIWIDGGDYPIGTDLKLFNAQGNSMVEQYWSFLSSNAYFAEEVEALETMLKPGQEFKKTYRLDAIVRLKEELISGTYCLKFLNSSPYTFQVK